MSTRPSNTPGDGNPTTSLGIAFQCLTTLSAQKLFPISVWTSTGAMQDCWFCKLSGKNETFPLTTAETGLLHGPDVRRAVLTWLPNAHLVVCEYMTIVFFNLMEYREKTMDFSPPSFKKRKKSKARNKKTLHTYFGFSTLLFVITADGFDFETKFHSSIRQLCLLIYFLTDLLPWLISTIQTLALSLLLMF